jgi:hypothetical protein
MRWTQPLHHQEAQTPARQPPTVTRPAQEPTQPRGPREEDRGTSTVPARAPAPDRTDTEVEDHCDGSERDGWTEDNPYGRGLQAPRLPRPESHGDCRAPSVLFCSRCGIMGLISRECPCPRPPAAPFPRAAGLPCRSTPNPRQPRSERRAHCVAAAGANVATTAVKPGHHRRQETSCSCSKTSLVHLYFFKKPFLIFKKPFF